MDGAAGRGPARFMETFMKKGKTLMRVFAEEQRKSPKLNKAGDVVVHPRLKGEWVVMASQMAGGETGGGMSGHDNWPDGHEVVLRKLDKYGGIDWKTPEKRFYQSGFFNEKSMLTGTTLVRRMGR